jgi:hypothetical protein
MRHARFYFPSKEKHKNKRLPAVVFLAADDALLRDGLAIVDCCLASIRLSECDVDDVMLVLNQSK